MGFTERLNPEAYRGDEPVAIGEHGTEPRGWTYVPERLFGRLVSLGQAYELHLLPVIDQYAATTLNAEQCVTLADELRFLGDVTNDPALDAVLESLIPVVDAIARDTQRALDVIGP